MEQPMRETLKIICSMVLVSTSGQLNNTKASGNIHKCMVREYADGLMAVVTKATTSKVKNKDMVNFTGQMVDVLREIGGMVNG